MAVAPLQLLERVRVQLEIVRLVRRKPGVVGPNNRITQSRPIDGPTTRYVGLAAWARLVLGACAASASPRNQIEAARDAIPAAVHP